jgi:O-antigen/teichoic acid export membrane protein
VSDTPSRARVARAVSWSAVGQIATQGTLLASLLILAAIVPPKDFGTLALGMVVVNLSGLLVDAGTRGSVIAAPELTRSDVRAAVVQTTLVGLAATIVIAVLAGPLVSAFAEGGDADAVRVLSLGVVFYAAGIVPLALLQKRIQFARFAGANVASAVLAATAGVIAAIAGAGVWALVLRQVLSMALLSVFAWYAARDLVPPPDDRPTRPFSRRQPRWAGFLLLALTDFVALNADFAVVGRLTAAESLGLYSLAFTLAFAPLTQISWQIGRVMFPAAAATRDLATVGRRTLITLRILALLLMPWLAPIIVLAPVVLPGLLGDEWEPMVAPFQILLVVGVAHALVGMIGESLSGTGNIGFRARVNAVWAVGMVVVLIVLVNADGIRGAALAHLILFVPFAAAYVLWGAPKLSIRPGHVPRALASLVLVVAIQAAVTVAVQAALDSPPVAAVAGLVVLVPLVMRTGPFTEARDVLAGAIRG